MNQKVRTGLDLWRIYANSGRVVPATWIARAVGVSPTTILKYLAVHCPEYEPRKGYSPNHGWNWSGAKGRVIIHSMNNVFYSNGEVYEMGPEMSQEELKEVEGKDGLLDFGTAMLLVHDGMAMARESCCERVIFKVDGKEMPQVGTSDSKGICTSSGDYKPTLEELASKDWFIDAHFN